MNSTDKANAGAAGTPDAREEPDERRLAGAEPVDGDRQQHDEQDQRKEREVGAERRVDAETPSEIVRLQDPEHLNGDRADEHLGKLRVVGGIPLNGLQQSLSRMLHNAAAAASGPSTVTASARWLNTRSSVTRQAAAATPSDADDHPVAGQIARQRQSRPAPSGEATRCPASGP